MPLTITQVDAFADRPFAGNPAAVCVLDAPPSDAWMQAVAEEMNLAETAFVVPQAAGVFSLRWFTPTVEVDLCGHATLAAAHVLWESGRLDRAAAAEFATRSGRLAATRGADGWITLDFPAEPARADDDPASLRAAVPPVDDLAAALGVEPDAIVATRPGRSDLLVEVGSAAIVRAARPDSGRVGAIEARGVILTARADAATPGGADFVSRFFGPRVGVPEDPVTGSAHCLLGPYWRAKLGRADLVGYQASRRGGIVRVALVGDRAYLGGRAVTVFRAELADPAGPGAEFWDGAVGKSAAGVECGG